MALLWHAHLLHLKNNNMDLLNLILILHDKFVLTGVPYKMTDLLHNNSYFS